jgi:elongation factor P
MEYLYNDGDNFYFMDSQNYEQVSLSKGEVKDAIKFLKENTKVVILFHEGKPVLLEFPIFVELKVVRTEPGVKGNTVSGGTKPAELETGAIIQVPLFIKEGDIVRVDTRTSKYVTRV